MRGEEAAQPWQAQAAEPSSPAVPSDQIPHPEGGAEPELLHELRRGLRSDEPLDLLLMVSGLLEVTDPRSRDPFGANEGRADRADLVESFLGTSYAETTAALKVMRVLLPEEAFDGRIEEELAVRRHPMPDWVDRLDDAQVERDVWFLTHVLGDGDDYFFGVTLPSGHALSAMVYVDHNLGSVVKDSFVISEPLEDMALATGKLLEDPDQSLTRVDAAGARAVMEDAIRHGALLYPPLVSDSWPVCRPLVEWMLRQLPAGGEAPERQEWSEAETAAIAEGFFTSPFGASMDRKDERGLVQDVLWFGTDYANGNPMLWSPVTVEMLLADWFPRKVVAPTSHLAKLPEVLRAFIRYCHQRVGIRDSWTEETLRAVDHWEPEYQRLIRTERPQGAAALLAGVMDRSHEEPDDVPGLLLAALDRKVGGRAALQNVDDEPLPDEPFEWAGVPDDIRPVVREMLDACDRCADELLDVEHRTAMRRFLSRAAVGEPAAFRRKASPRRGAAAVAWVTCRANDSAGLYKAFTVGDLLAWFGVKGGGVSDRAAPLLRANGVDPDDLYGEMDVGAPDLLTSRRRAQIIELRDQLLGD